MGKIAGSFFVAILIIAIGIGLAYLFKEKPIPPPQMAQTVEAKIPSFSPTPSQNNSVSIPSKNNY